MVHGSAVQYGWRLWRFRAENINPPFPFVGASQHLAMLKVGKVLLEGNSAAIPTEIRHRLGNYWRVHNALIDGHGHQLAQFRSHHVVWCKDPRTARARASEAELSFSAPGFSPIPMEGGEKTRNQNETETWMLWPL